MWGRKPRPVTTSVVQLSKTRTKRKRRKNDARRVSSPRERRERSHERLVALLLLARRFFSRFDARATTTTARAFDGTNFYTERESAFFSFFFVGRNGPFREIPSRREEILEALFLAAEIVVSDVKIRAKRIRRNFWTTTTTPAFLKSAREEKRVFDDLGAIKYRRKQRDDDDAFITTTTTKKST